MCTVVLSACVTLTVLVSHVSMTDVFGCSLVLIPMHDFVSNVSGTSIKAVGILLQRSTEHLQFCISAFTTNVACS